MRFVATLASAVLWCTACGSGAPEESPPAVWEGCLPEATDAPGTGSVAIDVGLEQRPESGEEGGEEGGEEPGLVAGGEDHELDTASHGLLEGGEIEVTPSWHLVVWPFGGAEGREAVYLTRRTGPMRYRFDLPDGLYRVTLELIDTSYAQPGQRVFSVRANGASLAGAVDIAAEVGQSFAFDPSFAVQVLGGALEIAIDAEPSFGGAPPLVAGLRVEPAEPAAPPAPADLEVRGSIGSNLLRWSPAPGAVGYEVRRDGEPVRVQLVRATHFVDRGAPIGQTVRYEVRAVGPTCLPSEPVTASATAADAASVALRVVQIDSSDADLLWLDANRGSNDEVDAIVTIDGAPYAAQVRNRGNSTRSLSKPGLRLDFADRSFEGREHWHLTSEIVDPTGLWQRASQAVLSDVGALAPRTETVLLVVNGQSWGPYTAIEAVREEMFEDRGIDPTGSLYRLRGTLTPEEDPEALAERYPPVGDADSSDLQTLLDWIAGASDDDFAHDLGAKVDLEVFVPYLAGQILVGNFDIQDGGHFLYHDPSSGRWLFIPWDLNNQPWTRPALDPATHTAWERPGAGNLLWSRALGVPEVRAALTAALERAVAPDGAFGSSLPSRIATIAADLEPEALRDAWRFRRHWEQSIIDGPESLETFAAERRAYLAEEGLARLRAIGQTRVVRAGRDDDGTWLEIENGSAEPLAAAALSAAVGPPWEHEEGVPLRGPEVPLAPGSVGRFATDEPLGDGLVLVTLATEEGDDERAGRLVDLVALPPLEPGAVWER